MGARTQTSSRHSPSPSSHSRSGRQGQPAVPEGHPESKRGSESQAPPTPTRSARSVARRRRCRCCCCIEAALVIFAPRRSAPPPGPWTGAATDLEGGGDRGTGGAPFLGRPSGGDACGAPRRGPHAVPTVFCPESKDAFLGGPLRPRGGGTKFGTYRSRITHRRATPLSSAGDRDPVGDPRWRSRHVSNVSHHFLRHPRLRAAHGGL